MLDDEIYDEKGNERFIPVLFDDDPESYLPVMLRGWTRCRVREFTRDDAGYEWRDEMVSGVRTRLLRQAALVDSV